MVRVKTVEARFVIADDYSWQCACSRSDKCGGIFCSEIEYQRSVISRINLTWLHQTTEFKLNGHRFDTIVDIAGNLAAQLNMAERNLTPWPSWTH